MKKLIKEQQKREEAIVENFAKTFNKIKRLDENAISEMSSADDNLINKARQMAKIANKYTPLYISDKQIVTYFNDRAMYDPIGVLRDFYDSLLNELRDSDLPVDIIKDFKGECAKIMGMNENTINEEERDFIDDFYRVYGRKPTKDEIDTQYRGKGKVDPNEPPVTYLQGKFGIRVGDTIRNKKTGEEYIVIKPTYHKRKFDDEVPGGIRGFAAIDFKDKNGKTYSGEAYDYEKVPNEEESKELAAIKKADDAQKDIISKELIKRGFFKPDSELDYEDMFNSFTKGILKHNEDIRNEINKIGAEFKLDDKIVRKYWHKFW